MDRGAWKVTVCGVSQSQIELKWLSTQASDTQILIQKMPLSPYQFLSITRSNFAFTWKNQKYVSPVSPQVYTTCSALCYNTVHQSLLFQWVGSSHQMAKVLEHQLQHQSFQCLFRLISFRTDWFVLLAVQGTLKSLQYHGSEASVLWRSAFFIVQLSHPYMTTWKTIALTVHL